MVKMMLERSSLYSSVCGTSSFAPCIVPTLRRGNAVVDAPASRNAGALQTEFPRSGVGTMKLLDSTAVVENRITGGVGEVTGAIPLPRPIVAFRHPCRNKGFPQTCV